MDLGALSASVAAADRGGYAIARKILDQAEFQGAQAISMLKDAAAISTGAPRGAVSPVPGPIETGQRLDVTA